MTLDLDPERRLALVYVPAALRPAVEALWRLDLALGGVLGTGREPMISRIRLAWWREALEKLDRERAPAEPVLQAVAGEVLPRGLSGAELAAMVDGWDILLSPDPLEAGDLGAFARARGGLLFRYTARLLGNSDFPVEAAGACWALVDLARHSANQAEAGNALKAVPQSGQPGRWPPALRPLGMLAGLARRDARSGRLGAQGSPSRLLFMLGHRLTGR